MKRLYHGFCAAFSLYSTLPVPNVEWNRSSLHYALCFFPLVGAVVGVLQLAWLKGALFLSLSPLLYAAVAVTIPLAVTGGIHMDGFVDTVDAQSSHASRERKLEILKDPHIGAFGVIWCTVSLLMQSALWAQLYLNSVSVWIPMVGYVASRSLNALSIALFTPAKGSGLVHTLAESGSRTAVCLTCGFLVLLSALVFLLISPVWGGVLIVALTLYFLSHYRFCMRQFGGNTGDLAGFLLQNVELFCLATAVACGFAPPGGLL